MRVLWGILLAARLLAGGDSLVQVFNQAVSALAAGNYSAAEKGFRDVLESAPHHPGALLNLGVVYSRMQRYDDAIAQYREVLKANPEEKSALANLAVAYVRKGSYVDALPVFQQLQRVNQDSAVLRDADLMYRFASGYLRQNGTEETRRAVAGLLPVLALCKVNFDAGRFDEAADACRRAGAHSELGKVLVSLHSQEATAELALAIAQNPKDPEAQYYMGVALLQEGRAAEAESFLDRAMQLNGDFWGTYFYLGRARLELGNPAQAVPLLRKASEMDPRAAMVFYELGRALMAAGKADESRQAMRRVRELRAEELAADAQALRKR